MITRRQFAAALGLAVLWPGHASRAEAAPGNAPVPIIQSFYDTLLGTMKEGQKLGFVGRRDRLAPAIRRSFNFPLMTRLMIGPQWQGLPPEQQRQLVDAFGALSIATYANRFDDFSGESFAVDELPVTLTSGDIIVKSQLVKSDGDKIELDYPMHDEGGRWQIIDVYLSGTVSELATRRSEFSSVMRRSGPAALVQLMQQKAVELSS